MEEAPEDDDEALLKADSGVDGVLAVVGVEGTCCSFPLPAMRATGADWIWAGLFLKLLMLLKSILIVGCRWRDEVGVTDD